MTICRLAPEDQAVTVQLSDIKGDYVKAFVKNAETGAPVGEYKFDGDSIKIPKLLNNVKYSVYAAGYDKNGNETERTAERYFNTGYLPGVCVSFNHADDGFLEPFGRYFGSPSVVKLSDGTIIASHDVFSCGDSAASERWGVDYSDVPACEKMLTMLYRSYDGGKTWEYFSKINNCTFGKLFEFNDELYIFCNISGKSGAKDIYNLNERLNKDTAADSSLMIGLYRSADCGVTWEGPCVITEDLMPGNFHKAATPLIVHNHRLWAAFEAPKDEYGFKLAVASADIDDCIMERSSWTISGSSSYNPEWEGTVDGVWPYMMEEANIVAAPDGQLMLLARYNSVNYCDEFIKAEDDGMRVIVMSVDKDDPKKAPVFKKMQHFIGSLSKFTVNYDSVSKRYYSVVSQVPTNYCCDRTILSLVSSANLENWKIERSCINLYDAQWHENCQEAGVYYCDWVIDGDDIIAVCRTAINGAYNYHDSNMLTFHRFRNFRNKNFNFAD